MVPECHIKSWHELQVLFYKFQVALLQKAAQILHGFGQRVAKTIQYNSSDISVF